MIPVLKRIRREKTGTDWQTFRDLGEYDQERSHSDSKGLISGSNSTRAEQPVPLT